MNAAGAVGAPAPAWQIVGLAAVLVAAVLIAGWPAIDAPWVQGDEFIFIVRSADVNPAADPGPSISLGARLVRIFSKVHDDLYQPIPVARYAGEWALTQGDPQLFRVTDIVLQACNALLVWWVLTAVLRRAVPRAGGRVIWRAWLLAVLWALHPMFVNTYASDMGRTHLLSALFSLTALGLYLRAMPGGDSAENPVSPHARIGYELGALAALLLAMLCKPVVGWVLAAFVIEALCRGWRAAFLSWRVWLVGLICVFFAGLTLWTSKQAGMMDDAATTLFGNPLNRSAFAVWLYFRNLVAPLWIAYWYPPDPRTSWASPLVWTGVALTVASLAHGVVAWRRAEDRWAAFGWAWCWALLLPVIGLIGARDCAAVDRYFYQPLIGVLVVVGGIMARRLIDTPPAAAKRLVLAGALLAAALVVVDRPQTLVARSTIRRAARLIDLNPGSPRTLEALAAAYDYARNHVLSPDELAPVPTGMSQYAYFTAKVVETLTAATSVPNLQSYFPHPEDLGHFYRRLSYRLLMCGAGQASLELAERARAIFPDEFMTWKRLAHAYQSVGRLNDAAAAYARCEELLPDKPDVRAIHYTDYGTLLLFDLDREAEGCKRFELAWETGVAPLPAKAGLALCAIRHGKGEDGFRLIVEALNADPSNVRFGMVLAEYHLRSHHWKEAELLYAAALKDFPTNYLALRGFQEVCQQIGKPEEAVISWQDALHKMPDEPVFAAFLVWSMAVANDPATVPAAQALLERQPSSPFGCFAMMMSELRSGRVEAAVDWIRRAKTGQPLFRAREFDRAYAAIQFQLARGQLPPDSVIALAAVWLTGDYAPEVRRSAVEVLDRFMAEHPDSAHADVVARLKSELSDSRPSP